MITKLSFPLRKLKKFIRISSLVVDPSEFALGFCTFPEISSNGRLAPYLAKARIIYATIHPFMDLTRVFYAGLPDVAPEDEDGGDDPK